MPGSKLTLIAASAAVILALSGCSFGSPTPSSVPSTAPTEASSQSTAESCAILEDAVRDATAGLQSAFAEAQSNPAGAAEKVQALADALDAGAAEVTDPDVKAAAEQARDSVSAMVDILEAVIADPTSLDLPSFQASATAVQDSFTTIGEICD